MRPKSPKTANNANSTLINVAEIFQNVSPPASPSSNRSGGSSKKHEKCIRGHPIHFVDIKVIGNWTLKYIAMAGKLLRKPPMAIQFFDEEEMRKVYSLIYDVFRYKNVLNEALTDVGFFAYYPELKSDRNRVWLLLFELYVRHFLKRHPEETDLQELIYREADLEAIATRLWEHRVKLAAAISRLRIKNGALQLSQLLPEHLKDEKIIATEKPIVSGWINPFKFRDITAVTEMLEKLGLTEATSETGIEHPLQQCQYRWDKLCPLFITCVPQDRSKFAQSDMVKNNYFVMQDKTFSVAPAILSRLLDFFELEGDIVKTHVSSPRSTAYLAALLYSVNRINNFLAFGVGNNLVEYKNYMKTLGVTNVRLHPESFSEISLEAKELDLVVGIFATPPNSFSGLADPIDLICSRGGDLDMLEVLTESNITLDGKKRIVHLLEEQKKTLRLALSHPKVQFVLYETHSIVGSENQDMIQQAVEDINELTFEKHLLVYKENKKKEALTSSETTSSSPPSTASSRLSPKKRATVERKSPSSVQGAVRKKKASISSRPKINSAASSHASNLSSSDSSYATSEVEIDNIKVPNTDQFIIADIPESCMNEDKNVNLSSFGCYVSLVHRKEITKLDEHLLAQIAEQKRLQGGSDRKKFFRPRLQKRVEGTSEAAIKEDASKLSSRSKKTTSVVERLSRPTHASLIRTHMHNGVPLESIKQSSHDFMKSSCTRHRHHHTDEYCSPNGSSAYMATMHLDSRAKRWWQETTHYIHNLRLLERRKQRFQAEQQNTANIRSKQSYVGNVDSGGTPNIFLESRIRVAKALDRKIFPVTINQLEFKDYEVSKNGQLNFFHQPKATSFQIAHRPIISRKPLGRYLLKDSQLVLSY